METCPTCNKSIPHNKLMKCKFCEKNFCALVCLVKHSQSHTLCKENTNSIITSLKRRQSQNLTEIYSFITAGIYKDKKSFDERVKYANMEKILDGLFPTELGKGSYGRVFLVRDKTTNKKYAMKVIDKKNIYQSYGKLDMIYNEINIQSRITHTNIIRIYNIYEDEDTINIIMEYGNSGNLYDLLTKEKSGLSEKRAFVYFIQVVNAVYFLHQNNIIHRDIKPENVLLFNKEEESERGIITNNTLINNNLIKLCDFGWAKELTMEKRSTFCGTIEYMAPEIVESENYDFGVDTWSLGVLLYELIMGHSPFKGKNSNAVINNIKMHELKFDKKISKECEDLIKKLLKINPEKRFKVKDIIDHPFILKHMKDSRFESGEKYFTTKKDRIPFPKPKECKSGIKLCSNLLLNKLKKMPSFGGDLKDSLKLEAFRESLNSELEKARDTVKRISFKVSKKDSFEDIRDKKFVQSSKLENRHKNFKGLQGVRMLRFDSIENNSNVSKVSGEKTFENIIRENNENKCLMNIK